MSTQADCTYYTARRAELLRAFEEESQHWLPIVAARYGEELARALMGRSRDEFEALLPQLPYIGGDDNHLTGALVEFARCLAFYVAMKGCGRTAEEAGKVLFDAAVARIGVARATIPPSQMLTPEQLMARRRERAERSQQRRYPGDYVYEFVAGDGVDFDYGYDFTECAAQKLCHAQGADEFMPFHCYLDYPKSTMGLRRTMTLAEGHPKCDHRFKAGRDVQLEWPPPFLRR